MIGPSLIETAVAVKGVVAKRVPDTDSQQTHVDQLPGVVFEW